MQQTILNQVNAAEQPQEEVQLTELLPVKRSRIRENILKDADATDALKVLRSFSGVCNEEQDFELRTFNFCEKIDRQEKQGGKQQRGQRRKIRRRKRHTVEDPKDDEDEEASAQNRNDDTSRRITRCAGKRSIAREKVSREKDSAEENYRDVVEKSDGGSNDKTEEQSKNEEASSGYDDDEEGVYLDLDKKNCFDDEVYVFRREDMEPGAGTNTDGSENEADAESDEVYDNYATTDGSLFDRSEDVQENRSRAGVTAEDKENKINSEQRSESRVKSSERELKFNIDAIIQANCLLKHENNNVVRPDRNKVLESEASSPAEAPKDKDRDANNEDKGTTSPEVDSKQDENQQKKFCCVICDARFKAPGGLRNHYKIVHGEGPIFKCNECGKEFPLKERLKLHVRTHTGFKPYKCSECGKSFARGGQLVQHRRTHSQEKPYSCALCTGTFTCAANLALHVKRHNGQKDHKCEICGRAFVRRDALKKHLECLHRDVKSFLCVICNKTFKGHLPQHMRTHARDRPHGCATCGQRFAQKSQLTVHQRTHSGQRPFRCLVCWQAFAHSTALKLHTRRHTGERPFKCSECNAGFTQLPHWKKHMKCIHGRNEPYGCKRCKSFFRIKNDLESHEKTCHPEALFEVDCVSNESAERATLSRFRVMTVERMRLLLAVLLKRISKQERLDKLGFGKRLIDEVLQDSLISAGKDPVVSEGLTELESLTKNLEIFLEWTVPKEHWENFRKMKKTPEDILETLTAT